MDRFFQYQSHWWLSFVRADGGVTDGPGLVLDISMQKIVEFSIGIKPTHVTTTERVLDRIEEYIRSKRSIALDLVAFAECRQESSESFDDFYIRMKGLAEAAEITTELEKWMTVRILAGSRDAEARQTVRN